MPAPRNPETVPEFRRIAHAFLAGSQYPPGTTVYLVMSTVAPMHRIRGVFGELRIAEQVLQDSVPRELRWTADEAKNRVIITAVVPGDSAEFNRVLIICKDEWTGESFATSDPIVRPGDRRSDQIERMELVVTYASGPVRYAIPKHAAAVFITRGAAEMFLLPHSLDTFGHEYERTLRGWLDGNSASGSGDGPSPSHQPRPGTAE
jgi:hypothetical protein